MRQVYYTGRMSGMLTSRRRASAALAAAAVLMAGLVYLNSLTNPFVYDDQRVIVENAAIRNPSNVLALLLQDRFRPVVNVTYAIDYAVWGPGPFGFHVTGVLFHMANVLMLFVLMRKLAGDAEAFRTAAAGPAATGGRKKPREGGARAAPARAARAIDWDGDVHMHANAAAFGAAAVWAVHPLMTQAVGYVSGRSEVVCAFFCLAALLCLHPWIAGGRRAWLVAALACWGLALGSKEVAAMLPVALLAYDRLLFAKPQAGRQDAARKRLVRTYVPMLAFVAIAGAARLWIFAGVENATRASFSWGNALVAMDVVRRYAALMFLAIPQSVFHTAQAVTSALRPIVIFDAVWMTALLILTWRVHRRAPVVAFGAAWFLLMLVPSVTMLVLDVGEPMAEQRLYLAGAGFAMATGAAFGRLHDWPRAHWVPARVFVTVALGYYLVMLSSATITRNGVWADPVRLWREAVVNAPDIWIPWRGLGDALRAKGDFKGAAEAYGEAARLRPQEVDTQLAHGVSLMLTGKAQEAYGAFTEAARLSPGLEQAEIGLGASARMLGRPDEARQRFQSVLKAHPNAVLPRLYLAEIYEQDDADPVSALRLCREAQAIAPQTPGVAECIRRNEQKAAAPAAAGDGR